jgi:hypothetical protein
MNALGARPVTMRFGGRLKRQGVTVRAPRGGFNDNGAASRVVQRGPVSRKLLLSDSALAHRACCSANQLKLRPALRVSLQSRAES